MSAPSTPTTLGETVTRPSVVISPAIPIPTETAPDAVLSCVTMAARAANSGSAPWGVGSRRVRCSSPLHGTVVIGHHAEDLRAADVEAEMQC